MPRRSASRATEADGVSSDQGGDQGVKVQDGEVSTENKKEASFSQDRVSGLNSFEGSSEGMETDLSKGTRSSDQPLSRLDRQCEARARSGG